MELHRTNTTVTTAGMGGQNFAVDMNEKLFEVLTASLYKDKPRAVARETIANAVDAHRERDFLFGEATPEAIAKDPSNADLKTRYELLKSQGFSDPGIPFHIHIPTDIEPWFSVQDFGIGLSVDQILGPEVTEVVFDEDGQPVGHKIVLDENGCPLRSGGLYTTLFRSNKSDNNRAIGAYGLGSKSPFSIVDTFTVISRLNGEEHQYLMYLNSSRTPMVDWLTKDAQGNPKPKVTDQPNGVCVRLDAIPISMKNKIKESVSEILQTFPINEQPIINDGMYTFEPMVTEQICENVRVVLSSKYGSVFKYNQLVVNTGGVAYPVASDKVKELMGNEVWTNLTRFADDKTIILDMPLGSVSIPPSREEISYDENSTQNIKLALDPVLAHFQKKVDEVLSGLSYNIFSISETKKALSRFMAESECTRQINNRLETLLKDIREQGKNLGFLPHWDTDSRSYVNLVEIEESKALTDISKLSDFCGVYVSDYWSKRKERRKLSDVSAFKRPASLKSGSTCIDPNKLFGGHPSKGMIIVNDTAISGSLVVSRTRQLFRDNFVSVVGENYPLERNSEKWDSFVGGNVVVLTPWVEPVHGKPSVPPSDEFLEIVKSDREKFGHITMDFIDKFSTHLSTITEAPLFYASDFLGALEQQKKDSKNICRNVGLSEVNRNMSLYRKDRSSYSDRIVIVGTHDIDCFSEKYENRWSLYMLESEVEKFTEYVNLVDELSMGEEFLQSVFDKHADLAEDGHTPSNWLFSVKGIRTQSRRAVDNAANFIHLDFDRLSGIIKSLRLKKFKKLTNSTFLTQSINEYGLRGCLTSAIFHEVIEGVAGVTGINFFHMSLGLVPKLPTAQKKAFHKLIELTGPYRYDELITWFREMSTRGTQKATLRSREETVCNEHLSCYWEGFNGRVFDNSERHVLSSNHRSGNTPLFTVFLDHDFVDEFISMCASFGVTPFKSDMEKLKQIVRILCASKSTRFFNGTNITSDHVEYCFSGSFEKDKQTTIGKILSQITKLGKTTHSEISEEIIKSLSSDIGSTVDNNLLKVVDITNQPSDRIVRNVIGCFDSLVAIHYPELTFRKPTPKQSTQTEVETV